MMAKNYVNSPGFIESLYDDPGLNAELQAAAERVAARVRATAPVGDSGEYKGSIHVEKSPRGGRPVYRVVADAPHAMLVESRTGNLARGVR
ncbi:hypothetical protein C7K25_15525 [Gulosibacter molinativorax]|uniref:HK97 gp10 family phage protein n=2 Tax=Gulosibacter molinativorax TaxID=256821 RepID=A0ABT7CCE0_9MICO|nr:hypothetical protein [Gulosibacter molinativorax]